MIDSKIIQLSSAQHGTFALCEDGSVWISKNEIDEDGDVVYWWECINSPFEPEPYGEEPPTDQEVVFKG